MPFLFLLLAFGAFPAQGQALSEADLQATRAALSAAQGTDWSRAYADVAAIGDPLPIKIVRWMDYSRPGAPGRFPDIAEFIEKNPEWPRQKSLRKHAEEALAGESDALAADWLNRYPAVSAAGKVRIAEIILNSGDLEDGIAALRETWTDADLGPTDEKNFLAHHGSAIRLEDNGKRLDRLLWDGRSDAARRMLPLASADWRSLAEARLALAAQAPSARLFVTRVRAGLRTDPGLVHDALYWLTKKDMVDAAVRILLSHPGNGRLSRGGCWQLATRHSRTVSLSSMARSKEAPTPNPSFCWAISRCVT